MNGFSRLVLTYKCVSRPSLRISLVVKQVFYDYFIASSSFSSSSHPLLLHNIRYMCLAFLCTTFKTLKEKNKADKLQVYTHALHSKKLYLQIHYYN